MKKIRILFFTLFICLISISGVSAAKRLECKYVSGHTTYKVLYNLNGDTSSVYKVYKTTEYVKDSESTNLYKDWFDVELNESSSCPSKLPNCADKTLTLSETDDSTQGENIEFIGPSQCYNYKSLENCTNSGASGKVVCVWSPNEYSPNGGFCNVDNLLYVGCGGANDIPTQVPAWISFLVNLLKIATPIILIFVSLITLIKALASSKEDEIKKAQSSLIKKIIAAVMVFFVIAIVQFVISKVAEDDEYQGFTDCMNCFLNNKCSQGSYYRTVVSGDDYCTPLTTGKTVKCDSLFK